MNMLNHPLFRAASVLAAPIVVASLSPASVDAAILSTDFSGVSSSGNNVTGVTWTQSGVSAASSTVSYDNAFREVVGGGIDVNNNIGDGGTYALTFDFTVGAADISDLQLTVAWVGEDGSGGGGGGVYGAIGGPQPNSSNAEFTVSMSGDISGSLGTPIASGGSNWPGSPGNVQIPPVTKDIDLSAFGTLQAGETYTTTISVAEFGANNGFYVTLTDLSFDGTVVPEPASLGLLGLSALAMGRRRR